MKEKDVEIILWDWLKTKGKYIGEVYFNRKNDLGWKIFRVEGNQDKPDMIIKMTSSRTLKGGVSNEPYSLRRFKYSSCFTLNSLQ